VPAERWMPRGRRSSPMTAGRRRGGPRHLTLTGPTSHLLSRPDAPLASVISDCEGSDRVEPEALRHD
jgi:hypothetical protein